MISNGHGMVAGLDSSPHRHRRAREVAVTFVGGQAVHHFECDCGKALS